MAEGIYPLKLNSHPLPTIIETLVLIHAYSILHDETANTSTSNPNLSYNEMRQDWYEFIRQTMTENRLLFMHLSKVSSRSSTNLEADFKSPFPDDHPWPVIKSNSPGDELEVSGVITLARPRAQADRGTIERLLVSPLHRRKGVATALIRELERRALDADRRDITVDATGLPPVAEGLFVKLDYKKEPREDENQVQGDFYVKDLRAAGAVEEPVRRDTTRFRRDRTA